MAEFEAKTLYIGNLANRVTENTLITLFAQIGPIEGCRIKRDIVNEPYAFVKFGSNEVAAKALACMNKRVLFEKEIRVNWACSPVKQISSHHHIFVGDLCPEVEAKTLREAFERFGEISYLRIVRDPETMASKGYAFISFANKDEAEEAIETMNGKLLGSQNIRTNWSTRKVIPRSKTAFSTRPSFEEIYDRSGATSLTVYCGGFPPNAVSKDTIQKHFNQFGPIKKIRGFKGKGFAFIEFVFKESAAKAIEVTHDTEINGSIVKCHWGKANRSKNAKRKVGLCSSADVGIPPAASQISSEVSNLTTKPPFDRTFRAEYEVASNESRVISTFTTPPMVPYATPICPYMGHWIPPHTIPYQTIQNQYIPPNYYPFYSLMSAETAAQQAPNGGIHMVRLDSLMGTPYPTQ